MVELVKDDYVVLSLPKHHQILGFAAVTDYNLQNQEGRMGFALGQQLQARVSALPSKDTGDASLPAVLAVEQDWSSFIHSLHSRRMLDRLSRPSWVCTGAINCLQPVQSCASLNHEGSKI